MRIRSAQAEVPVAFCPPLPSYLGPQPSIAPTPGTKSALTSPRRHQLRWQRYTGLSAVSPTLHSRLSFLSSSASPLPHHSFPFCPSPLSTTSGPSGPGPSARSEEPRFGWAPGQSLPADCRVQGDLSKRTHKPGAFGGALDGSAGHTDKTHSVTEPREGWGLSGHICPHPRPPWPLAPLRRDDAHLQGWLWRVSCSVTERVCFQDGWGTRAGDEVERKKRHRVLHPHPGSSDGQGSRETHRKKGPKGLLEKGGVQ